MLQYDNITVNVETSLQAGSVDSLPQLIDWCKQRNIRWDANSVYKPAHLQPFLVNNEILEKAKALDNKKINKLLEYNSTQENYDVLRQRMLDYYDMLSSIRKIDWKECLNV